jgi:hypothetical protein
MSASLSQPALWTRARASFVRAVDAIGAPAAIAAIDALTHTLRRTIAGCVLRLEHVVRKLLLAEAAALKSSPAWTASPPARIGAALERRSAALRAACAAGAARSNASKLDPSRPETWPARFSFALPRDPLAVPEARAPHVRALWGATPTPPPSPARPKPRSEEDTSALRLARRFEALRRVLENPIPHAERLARVLTRVVRRFPEIARRFFAAPARTNDFDREDHRLGLDAMTAAFHAPEAFADSS